MGTDADSMDITLDEELSSSGAELPFDRVRRSYDIVAANYANDRGGPAPRCRWTAMVRARAFLEGIGEL